MRESLIDAAVLLELTAIFYSSFNSVKRVKMKNYLEIQASIYLGAIMKLSIQVTWCEWWKIKKSLNLYNGVMEYKTTCFVRCVDLITY